MVVEQQYISADKFLDLLQLPEYADRAVELVEGVIVEMPLPNPIHAEILVRLSACLFLFVSENGLGRVLGGDAPFILGQSVEGRDSLRGLDIAFISSERLPGALTPNPIAIAPDLAIEIVSPSNTALDIEKKIQQLLEAGTRLIWIVYPDLRTVSVHSQDGATSLKENDTLSGGDVLPGFETRVGDIFPS